MGGIAQALGDSWRSIHELVRERRAVIPEMALLLARLFGNSPAFWLNAQRAVDLWDTAKLLKGQAINIKPLKVA